MSVNSPLEKDSETLRRVARDRVSKYVITEHASSRMHARGITIADIQGALRDGLVISDEEGGFNSKTRWRVRGKMLDEADIELIVSVSEQDKTIQLLTVYFPDALEELSGPTPSKTTVERRVEDWSARIETLYDLIGSWLPTGWSAERRDAAQMHEELMQRFSLPPRELPVLSILHDGKLVGSIEPRGLWIIGANGQLDFTVKAKRYVIFDTAKTFAPPEWHIAPLAQREKLQPLKQEIFLGLL